MAEPTGPERMNSSNLGIDHLKGLDYIVAERLRQVEFLGFDIPHDNSCHTPEELMRIGVCYADWAATEVEGQDPLTEAFGEEPHPFWPEGTTIPWKPEVSALETAVKGAAFIAAALDLMHAQLVGEVSSDEEA